MTAGPDVVGDEAHGLVRGGEHAGERGLERRAVDGRGDPVEGVGDHRQGGAAGGFRGLGDPGEDAPEVEQHLSRGRRGW